MSEQPQSLDQLLANWPFSPGQVLVRQIQGADGRDVLQMRVDMGIMQMEIVDRPDGVQPEGFNTYFDYLLSLSFAEGESFEINEEQCQEIDREFYQFYHRRICWLTLKKYPEAVQDAQHTLSLMDFSSAFAPDPQWALLHEQYRPFVMFHKIQAAALIDLEQNDPASAIDVIDKGLQELAGVFDKYDASDHYEEDAFVVKLREMRASIVEHYELSASLAEQLAEAIAAEQYELAAKLRDRMDRGRPGK
ncbi:MAG TPA: DNA helicase UvrBC [Planctomycetaceae bacterium]|nr:DNA helicase UvrBC [Planctomycetaceae bacterium]|tara:strand:+ start:805 stop:1548 length:744 start_codon:yes stop_codon:yes gene_type:complete